MLATRPSPPDGARSTVLPLGVVVGRLVDVLGRFGVDVLGRDVDGRLTVPPLLDVDGTSLSCGCDVS
jgi:hypothetical protein